jgi:glucokinase
VWPKADIHVINDLTAAGYHFVQQGYRDFCVVGVGSGIGNKVFLDGRPLLGNEGHGGEIGHLRMSPQPGTICADLQGELGHLASGRGVVWLSRLMSGATERVPRNALDQEHSLTEGDSERLVAAFRAGDARVRHAVRAATHPLALAIGALHLGIGLTRFFIVGGFAKALGPDYRDMLVSWCRELTWDVGQDWNAMIELGRDEAEEGLAGGAWFASQQRRRAGAKL